MDPTEIATLAITVLEKIPSLVQAGIAIEGLVQSTITAIQTSVNSGQPIPKSVFDDIHAQMDAADAALDAAAKGQ